MASSARIDELLKKFDENPRRYFAPLANEYRKAGDVQRAIELCREHLPQQPGHMSGHIVYGQALFEARDFDEARQVFEEALRLDPENLIALRHLGDIARDHGDVAAARDWYQRVLDADPRNEEIAAQIASLASLEAPDAPHAVADAGADATTAPMLDTDLIADIAAGVAEPPAAAGREAAAAAPATPVDESHFLDDALLGATFGGTTAPARSGESATPDAPADFTGTIDLPAAAGRDAVAPAAGAGEDLGLDFDAMESTAASAAGGQPRDDLDLDLESIGGAPVAGAESAPRKDAAPTELPTEELSISDLSSFASGDESRFGEIQLGDEAAGRRDSAASLELDEALAESGLAPTPAGGMDATPTDEAERADFSDFALAEAPAEGTRAERERPDRGAPIDAGVASASEAGEPLAAGEAEAAASPAAGGAETSEGYSLGRLAGLEPMEFVPPDAAATQDAYDDPTFGRTLREDTAPAAATPAAFVTETMAELYLQQGFNDEALAVYRQLLQQHPDDANLRDRVAQLERGSVSALSAAAVSSSVIEAAQQRGAAQGGRSVRSFFASLASRRAPVRSADVGADRESPSAGGADEDASAAEATASDAYVEAIGEGYDGEARAGDSAASDSVRAPSFDEFGFPEVAAPAPAARRSGEAAEGEEAVGAELPESAAIEPATLDYLAHEGATAAEAGVVPESEAGGTEPPPDAAASAGPVDTLFDGASVDSRDEAAAATLADAFGPTSGAPRAPTGGAQRVPTPGRGALPARDARTPATRPAARELSLDDVFRETPRRSGSVRREAGGPTFSFDQFFAEGSGGGASGASKPEPSASGEAPRADAQPSADDSSSADIEQFNSWLEGLKKK